jgi:hypothetical protein
MTNEQLNKRATLHRALGASKPPEKITQEAFEGDNRHLRRLVRLAPSERANASDLWEYTQDLCHTKIQGPLLAYLLPFCLEAWREDLRGFDGYGGFVEHLYPVLADRHVFDVHLTPKQTEAVSTFMRESILEEIDEQRGLAYQGMNARPYRWIRALTSYGVLLPDVQRIWTAWWSLDTIGRAIAAVQYISCLMYSENENPVFSPWTRDGGGGPPCLWEFEGLLYEHRWLEANATFLKGTLNPTGVSEVLSRAVKRLTEEPENEMAARVLADLPLCIATVESRCAELPLLLQTRPESTSSLKWSI